MNQNGGGWRPWGDHPIVVLIAVIAGLLTIYTSLMGVTVPEFLSNLGPVYLPNGTPYFEASGEIPLSSSDVSIQQHSANILNKNFEISITLNNPNNSQLTYWDYGITLRDFDNRNYYVVITSDATWRHIIYSGGATEVLAQGTSQSINIEAGKSNRIEITVLEKQGWLFINGDYVAELDLSLIEQPGTVAVIGAYEKSKFREGLLIFKDWSINPLVRRNFDNSKHTLFVPNSRDLNLNEHASDINNFIVRLRFHNPTDANDDWVQGLNFNAPDGYYYVGISGRGEWTFSQTDFGSQYHETALVNTDSSGQNTIMLLYTNEGKGRYFINGVFVRSLDFSLIDETGDLNVFSGSLADGTGNWTTTYEDLEIWTIP